MHHKQKFIDSVNDAKTRIKETDINHVKAWLDQDDDMLLIDVRERIEWDNGHLPNAIYLGKGILERDIETMVPDSAAKLVLYCGGGYRSALAADSLQKMGYTNVISMDGGYRHWTEANYPTEND
ncbi:MAG: rhodanese-like domain-containing protein [Coxiellaceae bacterium]|nr:rhodanese-like domain-containing protein [Coxiellaceae bacterium]